MTQVLQAAADLEKVDWMPDDNFRVSIPVDQLLGEINLKLENMSMRLRALENDRIVDQTESRLRASSVRTQKWLIGTLCGGFSGLGVYLAQRLFSGGHG